jgi:hypothetical protein
MARLVVGTVSTRSAPVLFSRHRYGTLVNKEVHNDSWPNLETALTRLSQRELMGSLSFSLTGMS